MTVPLIATLHRRMALRLTFVLVLIAGSLSRPTADCPPVSGGACPAGDSYWFIDCSCDDHNCPGGPEGPPYFVCVDRDCSQWGVLSAYCRQSLYVSRDCITITNANIDCPCNWFECFAGWV